MKTKQIGGYPSVILTYKNDSSNTRYTWYAKYLCQDFYVGYFQGEGNLSGFNTHGATSKISRRVISIPDVVLSQNCNLDLFTDLTAEVNFPDRLDLSSISNNNLHNTIMKISTDNLLLKHNYVLSLTPPSNATQTLSATKAEMKNYYYEWVHNNNHFPQGVFTNSTVELHKNAQELVKKLCSLLVETTTYAVITEVTYALYFVVPKEVVKKGLFSWSRNETVTVPKVYLYTTQNAVMNPNTATQNAGGFKKTSEKVILKNKLTRCVYKGPRGVKYVRLNKTYVKLTEAVKKTT
jgi:hypothetical protein